MRLVRVRRNSMFFKNLSRFNYTFKDLGVQPMRAINPFKRARIDLKDKAHRDSFYYYNIQAGDTPEIISQKAYSNPHYFWAILMFNDIVNPFSEMPRSETVVETLEEQQFENMGSFFYEDDNELGLSSADGYTRSRFPRVGDIVVKLDGNSPASTLVSVQIVGLDKTLQRIDFLTTTENGLFAEGDSFAIIDKTGEDTYEIAYRSKILKRFDDKTKAYASFKTPEGKSISPLAEAPNKLFATSAEYEFYVSQLGNENIKYTLLGEFVESEGSGSKTASENEGYRALNLVETAQEKADDIKRIKIPDARLLQPMLTAMSDTLTKSPLSDTVVANYNSRIK
jgi:hypothetical protein